MKIEAWFDGVCEPRNPGGYAAYGVLVKVNGKVIFEDGKLVGNGIKMSNNVAEYSGVIAVLQKIKELDRENATRPVIEMRKIEEVIIRGDSKLVIEQLSKRWQVRQGAYIPYHKKAASLLSELSVFPSLPPIEFEWISRDDNGECDRLSKKVLLDMGVKFRIQPEKK